MNRRRFANAKPTKFGRIGHPEAEGNKMFKCAGVIFTDRATNIRWCLRLYHATPDTPDLTVWTQATWKQDNRYTGFAPQEVVREDQVDEPIREFAYAELVRLRLTGRVFI